MQEEDQYSVEIVRIQKEAAEWVVLHDKGLSAEQQDRFFQWLADDPRHGEAFADGKQSWGDFNLLAQWRPEHSEEPNPDLLATIRPVRPWKRWTVLGGLAAVFALAAVVWITQPQASVEPLVSYNLQYSALDYGFHELEDGSEIDLNEGTELVVAYSSEERLVKLVSGEAHFIVRKDEARPFIVEAGGTTVLAVGTAFNVRLADDSVEVLVTEGRVRMEDFNTSGYQENNSALLKSHSRDLLSGQRSILSFKEKEPQVEVSTIETDEIRQLLKWKPDLLDFSSTPLSEAILEFNARNEVQIVIADSELAHQPIVASFRSNNINGFVRLLKLTMGIEADRPEENQIVLYNSL